MQQVFVAPTTKSRTVSRRVNSLALSPPDCAGDSSTYGPRHLIYVDLAAELLSVRAFATHICLRLISTAPSPRILGLNAHTHTQLPHRAREFRSSHSDVAPSGEICARSPRQYVESGQTTDTAAPENTTTPTPLHVTMSGSGSSNNDDLVNSNAAKKQKKVSTHYTTPAPAANNQDRAALSKYPKSICSCSRAG